MQGRGGGGWLHLLQMERQTHLLSLGQAASRGEVWAALLCDRQVQQQLQAEAAGAAGALYNLRRTMAWTLLLQQQEGVAC